VRVYYEVGSTLTHTKNPQTSGKSFIVPYDLAKLKEKWTSPSVGSDVSQSCDSQATISTAEVVLGVDVSIQSGNLKAAALDLMPQSERSMVEGSCKNRRWSDGSFYQSERRVVAEQPGADHFHTERKHLELQEKAYRLKCSVIEVLGEHHLDAARRETSILSAHQHDQHVQVDSSFPQQPEVDEDIVAHEIVSQLCEFAGVSAVFVTPESVAPNYHVLVCIEGGSLNPSILSVHASQAALTYDSPAKTVMEAANDPAFRMYIADCVETVNQELLVQGFVGYIHRFSISASSPGSCSSPMYAIHVQNHRMPCIKHNRDRSLEFAGTERPMAAHVAGAS
jgi:hypothetical protein